MKRDQRIEILVSKDEAQNIEKYAESIGLKMGTFCRMAAIERISNPGKQNEITLSSDLSGLDENELLSMAIQNV